ncbi:hypothetical protein SAMN04487962_101177 [Marinobacter segnicrescens]|uniref:Uncharacterized protein n=1 Tax=Marinobacter segnicrescens TaxID=430453 RepID=A0A1H9YHW3_9GAMM|nr:hypothetical protein SAMN04487962_101177 [Marinobacter segnicrescens]
MSVLTDFTQLAWKETLAILAEYYGDYASAQCPAGHSDSLSRR